MIDSLSEDRNEDEDCEYQDTFGGEVIGAMNVVNGGTQRSFAPRAKAGEARRTKGRTERRVQGRVVEKRYKGCSKGGKSAGGKDSPWAKDRGHISRGARGKELGKVRTASAWTSTRRA